MAMTNAIVLRNGASYGSPIKRACASYPSAWTASSGGRCRAFSREWPRPKADIRRGVRNVRGQFSETLGPRREW